MTHNTVNELEISELAAEGEILAEGDILEGFGLVMRIDSKGRVTDAVVNAPTKVTDPEIVAKISLVITVLARNLLNYINMEGVDEINISFNRGMLLIVPEGDVVRVALTTAP